MMGKYTEILLHFKLVVNFVLFCLVLTTLIFVLRKNVYAKTLFDLKKKHLKAVIL